MEEIDLTGNDKESDKPEEKASEKGDKKPEDEEDEDEMVSFTHEFIVIHPFFIITHGCLFNYRPRNNRFVY